MTVNWLIGKMLWLILEININNLLNPEFSFAQEEFLDDIEDGEEIDDSEDSENDLDDYSSTYFACEKRINLYKLEQNYISYNFHGEYSKSGNR